MTPAAMQRVHELRQKLNLGTITKEEMKEAVKLIREDRRGAVEAGIATAAAKRKSAAAKIDVQGVLDAF